MHAAAAITIVRVDLYIPGGSKNVPLDKCNFSTTDRIVLLKFQDLWRKEFSTILDDFILKYVHCFKNYSFYNILFRISKLHLRNSFFSQSTF